MPDRVKDQQLLDALHDVSGGSEFVEADAVARKLQNDPSYRWPQSECSAIGVGVRLSRLSRSGRCDSQLGVASRAYRSFAR